jgi:hypothetical protein
MILVDEQKLVDIAENIPKVFNAGYEKGKAEGGTSKEEQEKKVTINKNGTTEVLPDENKTLSKVTIEVDVEGEPVFYATEGRVYKESIEFPETVTSIGNYAFYNCTGLTNVVIPETVTSIGNFAFSNCTGLTNVVIPNSVTKLSNYIFNGCTGLTSVNIPNSVTSIGMSAFDNTGLTSVVIPNSVTSILSNAFRILSLTTVTIPNSITDINSNAFNSCFNLEFVTIEQGFNCDGLRLSTSTKYSVETIVSWGEALFDRTGLEPYTLIIGATNIEKLTDEQKAIFTNKNWTLA